MTQKSTKQTPKKDTKSIYDALSDFQSDLPSIKKTKKGKTSAGKSFMFAPLDGIKEIIDPLLHKHNLLLRHKLRCDEGGRYSIIAILTHPKTKEFLTSGPVPITNGSGLIMQEFGARITYARRYSTEVLLGIVSEDDQDVERISDSKVGEQPQNKSESISPKQEKPKTDVEKIKQAIGTSKSVVSLEKIREKNKQSENLTDEQKKEFDNLISNKVNKLLDEEMS